ncbi:uncharacterized protein LOC117228963 [Megalopta genalis]|uniref:uncharacterized protein LOC117228963 n=1 Tax=Megalopta genalis TaxID=115081 RepID=UPI003FD6402A
MEAKSNIKIKENSEAMPNTICSSKSEEHSCETMEWMNKYLKDLKIQENVGSKGKQGECLAGNITNIIKKLNVVLVKPYSSDILLYIGTPLFLNCSDSQNCETKYIFLGGIDDIFGSIEEPMYAINIKCDLYNNLNINAELYYFPDNPNTYSLHIEYTIDKSSDKKKYRLRKKSL